MHLQRREGFWLRVCRSSRRCCKTYDDQATHELGSQSLRSRVSPCPVQMLKQGVEHHRRNRLILASRGDERERCQERPDDGQCRDIDMRTERRL